MNLLDPLELLDIWFSSTPRGLIPPADPFRNGSSSYAECQQTLETFGHRRSSETRITHFSLRLDTGPAVNSARDKDTRRADRGWRLGPARGHTHIGRSRNPQRHRERERESKDGGRGGEKDRNSCAHERARGSLQQLRQNKAAARLKIDPVVRGEGAQKVQPSAKTEPRGRRRQRQRPEG